MKDSLLRLGILISGSGTTMEAVTVSCHDGDLAGKVNPVVVISSRENAGGVEKARKLEIPVITCRRRDCPSEELFGLKFLEVLDNHQVNLVAQLGWLPKTPENVLEFYRGMIFNQHPGPLDPGRDLDFGGQGMYGARVSCARLAYCWATEETSYTEATTHFVDQEYDKGLLLYTTLTEAPIYRDPVTIKELKNDPAFLIRKTGELQETLLPLEHQNVINTLLEFTKGTAQGYTRKHPLIPPENSGILRAAKELAIELFPKG